MTVIRTDEWLDKDFAKPIVICEKFLKEFRENDPKRIYEYLSSFGMYRPNVGSYRIYEELKEKDVWKTIRQYYEKYKEKWKGPEVNIYIFPTNQHVSPLLRKKQTSKSGVSFPDRMYLFIGPFDDVKELEALFVHEYHHICRISRLRKDPNQFTLLDSIILEGLAELEVERSCGSEYLAEWCHSYSDEEIEIFMEKYLVPNLYVLKNDELHDELLFGYRRYPKLLGYACGFYLVRNSYKENYFSTKTSFTIPGKYFITSTEGNVDISRGSSTL